MDVELRLQDKLVELVLTASNTVPAKPLTGATVAVEVPVTPALTETVMGLAEAVKSWAWMVTPAECDKSPFVPVTVAR